MTLQKITVDNSVKHVPQSDQTREIKSNTIRNFFPEKQIKKISQNIKNIIKSYHRKDSEMLNDK